MSGCEQGQNPCFCHLQKAWQDAINDDKEFDNTIEGHTVQEPDCLVTEVQPSGQQNGTEIAVDTKKISHAIESNL